MTALDSTPEELTFTASEVIAMIHSASDIQPPPVRTASDELESIRYRFTYLAEGLEGLGVALTCNEELTEKTMNRLASAVYALGQYAGDLTSRLDDAATWVAKEEAPQEEPQEEKACNS